jgi:hypothetical protein
MLEPKNNAQLPPIPGKRYFTIGEVSDLCGVKPHVLRYWEQEFPQLKPVKRRGNRRYYQRQDVIVIRQIRSLCTIRLHHRWRPQQTRGREARTDEPEPADRQAGSPRARGTDQDPQALGFGAAGCEPFVYVLGYDLGRSHLRSLGS